MLFLATPALQSWAHGRTGGAAMLGHVSGDKLRGARFSTVAHACLVQAVSVCDRCCQALGLRAGGPAGDVGAVALRILGFNYEPASGRAQLDPDSLLAHGWAGLKPAALLDTVNAELARRLEAQTHRNLQLELELVTLRNGMQQIVDGLHGKLNEERQQRATFIEQLGVEVRRVNTDVVHAVESPEPVI